MNILEFEIDFDLVIITEGVVDAKEFFAWFRDCADYEGVEPTIDYTDYYDYYDYYDDRVTSGDNKKEKRPLGSWFHQIAEEFGISQEKTVKRKKHRKSNKSQNKRNKKRKNEKRQNNKNNNKRNKKNSNSNKTTNKRQFPVIDVSTD